MKCRTASIGGVTAIVCSRRPRRQRCSNGYPPKSRQCARWSTKLCDYPIPGAGGKTCDKPLCSSCAVSVGADRDFCPNHPREPEQGAML